MAVELVRHSDSRIDRQQLAVFVNSYQRIAPLTIGELWAWPSMLKLALIENLRRLAAETLASRTARLDADAYVLRIERGDSIIAHALPSAPGVSFVVQLLHRLREYGVRLSPTLMAVEAHLAAQGTTAEAAVRGEHQRQAANHVSVANAVTSLRLCSAIDWRQAIESVSLVEQVLQRDPAGAYGRMDFLSRDRQRQAIEELAAPSGDAQVRVALHAVESARQAAANGAVTDRAAHVGYHLIDHGRRELETDVAYRPSLIRRGRRFVAAHATPFYLGAIGAATVALSGAGAWYAQRHGAGVIATIAAAALLAVPAADLAVAIAQRIVAWLVAPRRLPRFDLSAGVPGERAHDGGHPHPAHQPGVGGGVARASRSRRARQPRSTPALRHPRRLHRRRRRDARRRRGDSRRGTRRHRGAQPAFRARPRRSLLPLSSPAVLERAPAGVDGMGAQARQDRRVQPAAARRRRHQLRGAGRRHHDSSGGALRHHARHRHPIAARHRENARRHHRAPTEPAAIRHASGPRHRRLRHPAAARQRDDGERGRLAVCANLCRPHRGGPVHHRRLRRLSGPVRGRHLHRQGAVRRRCVHRRARGPRPRKHVAVARSVRGPVCADGAGHRGRARRRLSVERPGARPPAAPLGAGRLANSLVALSLRAIAWRPAAQSPADHLALEDSRQPAPQPERAGDRRPAARGLDRPARASAGLDRGRPRASAASRRLATAAMPRRTVAAGAGGGVPANGRG